MKRINLYDIGKAFHQRAHRDPTNAAKQKAHDLSKELWHNKKSKDELLAIIAQLKPIERTFRGIRVYYADIAEKAVRAGNYEVTVPPEISHRYDEQPGRVYVLTSSTRPGECKLGATTMTIVSRCIAYWTKYGYRVEDYFTIESRTPFSLEKLVAERISHLRVAGNVRGDSIEWYRIQPDELKKLILRVEREMTVARLSAGRT
jgi:hypothetical protein